MAYYFLWPRVLRYRAKNWVIVENSKLQNRKTIPHVTKVSANLVFANLARCVNFLPFLFCITFSKKYSSLLSVKRPLHHPLRKQIGCQSGRLLLKAMWFTAASQPNNITNSCMTLLITYFPDNVYFLIYRLFVSSAFNV